MPSLRKRSPAAVLPLLVTLALFSGCVFVFRTVDVVSVDHDVGPQSVSAPLKVHLVDGSVVLFRFGATFTDDALTGVGQRFSLSLGSPTAVDTVSLGEVAAVETFDERFLPSTSIAVSLAATTAAVIGVPLLAVAIFGSCPTIYSKADTTWALEAEAFSNSIASLLEMRDVDRLQARPDAAGLLELDIRNEALETHYINHIELVEVAHAPGTFVVPGELGRALVLDEMQPAARMRDRSGRDVSGMLRTADGIAYSTPRNVLESATLDDLADHVDLTMPHPSSDTVAVYLRLRNSLLNTVLFYDYMLKRQGPAALDWLSRELNTVGTAIELGDFYTKYMRLRVQVREGDTYREVGQVAEVGPIAWSDIAVRVPVPAGDSLHIRLSFIADAWRIDRASIARGVHRSGIKRIPVTRVVDQSGKEDEEALAKISRPDDAYLVRLPSERMWLQFETDSAAVEKERTYFIAAQGYYTEWMRGAWLREEREPRPFIPSAETLLDALQRWQYVKFAYEDQFEKTKIPVQGELR